METQLLPLSALTNNTGQIEGLPRNPRTIRDSRFMRLAQSLRDDPEMLQLRPLVAVERSRGKHVVIMGNMRLRALRHIGAKQAPVLLLPPDTPPEKLRAFTVKDNNSFGENEWEALANEWDTLELENFGLEVWQNPDDNPSAFEDRHLPPPAPSEEDEAEEGSDSPDTEEADTQDQSEADFSLWHAALQGDYLYPSDNAWEVPLLDADMQATAGLALPLAPWGADARSRKDIATYHFYVDDYRFEALWRNPQQLLSDTLEAVVEPNLSLFDTMPLSYGLFLIYKKRWMARHFQELGLRLYVDLNVPQKFCQLNQLGVPRGWDAFFTRGYADRLSDLDRELAVAQDISGREHPHLIVYGGGDIVKQWCQQHALTHVDQFAAQHMPTAPTPRQDDTSSEE